MQVTTSTEQLHPSANQPVSLGLMVGHWLGGVAAKPIERDGWMWGHPRTAPIVRAEEASMDLLDAIVPDKPLRELYQEARGYLNHHPVQIKDIGAKAIRAASAAFHPMQTIRTATDISTKALLETRAGYVAARVIGKNQTLEALQQETEMQPAYLAAQLSPEKRLQYIGTTLMYTMGQSVMASVDHAITAISHVANEATGQLREWRGDAQTALQDHATAREGLLHEAEGIVHPDMVDQGSLNTVTESVVAPLSPPHEVL